MVFPITGDHHHFTVPALDGDGAMDALRLFAYIYNNGL